MRLTLNAITFAVVYSLFLTACASSPAIKQVDSPLYASAYSVSERFVTERERIYLDRFRDEFAATPAAISEAMRERYAQFYQRPRGLFGAFSHFAAFEQDAADNLGFSATRLPMPVRGIGGEHRRLVHSLIFCAIFERCVLKDER